MLSNVLVKVLGLAFASVVMLLSGCVAPKGLPFASKPAETIVVYKKTANIVVGGPTGFCVNNRQSHTGAAGAFVVFGPCVATTGTKGLFIANVSPKKSGNSKPEVFAAFFKTEAGLNSLSNSGDASTVEILETTTRNGVFFLHSRDKFNPLLPETARERWHGFFTISGHIVSVSMVNFIENPLPLSVAFHRLVEFSSRIKQLNKG